MKKIIEVDHKTRFTAAEAMESPWCRTLGAYVVEKSDVKDCLISFNNFRHVGPLQKAFIVYLVTQLFSEADLDFYKKIFYAINTVCDGNLTRAEFLIAYWKVGLKQMSEIELDRTLAHIDDDQNGYLTFGEFIVAAVNPKEILTK